MSSALIHAIHRPLIGIRKMSKEYKISKEEIEELIPSMGGCIATDKITVEGMQVGYMYREKPDEEFDNGWRFFSGTETQDYVDNPENSGIYAQNTIANYDRAIIPYLHYPYGSQLERIAGTDQFHLVED